MSGRIFYCKYCADIVFTANNIDTRDGKKIDKVVVFCDDDCAREYYECEEE